jgi:hypothetical protein
MNTLHFKSFEKEDHVTMSGIFRRSGLQEKGLADSEKIFRRKPLPSREQGFLLLSS